LLDIAYCRGGEIPLHFCSFLCLFLGALIEMYCICARKDVEDVIFSGMGKLEGRPGRQKSA
jgi:hypothetical protein